jgi:Zn-dependent protease
MEKKDFPEASAVFLLSLLALSYIFAAALTPSCVADSNVRIQLCMIIDGSGSINNTEWTIITNAVAEAVNETIPHDGSIEFSIVQFGDSGETRARTELSPVVLNSSNYPTVSSLVLAIPKMGGGTPTADGIELAWSVIRNGPTFSTGDIRQVINLATDDVPGVPRLTAGTVNAKDDAVDVVGNATSQGLDEIDVEGIGINDAGRVWFRDYLVRPQPGIVAPPFDKQGWIRIVADATEFANTLGRKFQAIIGGQEVWTPSALGAFVTGIITVGIASVVSAFASAVTNPETFPSQAIAQRISAMFPDTLKKWLHEFISSKRKLVIGPRPRPPFVVTKLEVISYVVSLSVLTFAFAYAKAVTLNEILTIIPTVLATSIIVEFTKNYVISVVARIEGVWTEHRLWYFGLTLFMFSSLVFRVPFSSPSRLTHNAPEFTRKSLGLVAAAQILIAIAFAVIFYGFFINRYTLIGNIGIVMCLTMAFFDSIPIPPMNGKDIYDWSKFLWVALFISTFTLYMLVLFVL